jgi:hypothetical protein
MRCDTAHPVGGEELVLGEQAIEEAEHPVDVDDTDQQLPLPGLAAQQPACCHRGHVERVASEQGREALAECLGPLDEDFVDDDTRSTGTCRPSNAP